jgi:thiamine biosynthesis protein ThiC
MPSASTKSAKKKKPAPALDAPTLAWRHISNLQKGKTGYKKADAAFEALMKQVKAGDIIELPANCRMAGKKFEVKDKFATKIQVNVGMNARRFELDEITEP